MKKILLCFYVFFCLSFFGFSQDQKATVTAASFFAKVSEKYAGINNYVVNITIKSGSTTQSGVLRYRKPNFVRVDFYSPRGQYILFANDMLNVYLPHLDIVLSQKADTSSSGASLASGGGLALMKRSYIIAFETDSRPHPIYEGSKEMAIVLSMERRNGSEPFKKLRVMISPDTNLIRRIEGFPVVGEKVIFDFSSYKLNPGVPGGFFVFDPEHTTTILNDFLYME